MTHDNGKNPGSTDEGWTMPVDPSGPGLGRRTVVKGAAWSIPVIAAAIATPLAAASVTPTITLAFEGPYVVPRCGVLSGAVVTATNADGSIPAGQPVTITLPAGYAWTDNGGSEPRISPTGLDGRIILDDITVSTANGTLGASTDGAVTAAGQVTVTSAPVVTVRQAFGTAGTQHYVAGGFPGDSTSLDMGTNPAVAIGYGAIRTDSGDLYLQNGTMIASGVVDYDSFTFNNTPYVRWINADGSVQQYNVSTGVIGSGGATIPGATSIKVGESPASGVALGAVLTGSGALYLQDGTQLDSDVVDYVAFVYNNTAYIRWVRSDGTVRQYSGATGTIGSGGATIPGAVSLEIGPNPTNSIGFGAVRASNGDLFLQDGTQIASGTVDYEAFTWNNTPYVRYILGDGSVRQYNVSTGVTGSGGNTIPGATSLQIRPNPSTPSAFGAVHTQTGDLFLQNGVKLGSNVVDYEAFTFNDTPYVRWIERTEPQC